VEKEQVKISLSFRTLVVGLKDFPSGGAHESLGLFITGGTELSHFRSRDKFEVFGVRGFRVEEFHFVGHGVEGSNLEGRDLDSTEHGLGVDEELLSVPSVVQVSSLFSGVTNTSGVSSSDEVSDTAVDSGGGVP
jgi:hypothetical protein